MSLTRSENPGVATNLFNKACSWMDSCISPSITTRYWSNSLMIVEMTPATGSPAVGGWAATPATPTVKAMEKARTLMEVVFRLMLVV